MAYKKRYNGKKRNKLSYKRSKSKRSIQEKRSFWTGFGIALERMKNESGATRTKGEQHLISGWVPSVDSANKGYDAAMKLRKNDYKLFKPFSPSKK